jgi:perosamine synthetase
MSAMDIRSGDEVILPTQTFIATASSVARLGAKPVFAEIDRDFLLDADKIEQYVTRKTKAVILVHFSGLLHNKIFEMREWLNSLGIPLIEDAAHSHGASIKGAKAGALGDVATFSFYSTKNMTTGEGGMITTDDQNLADSCASIRARGLDIHAGDEIFSKLGTNQRMTDVQALMGQVQIKRLDEFVKHRNGVAETYNRVLQPAIGNGLIEIPVVPNNVCHAYWRYVVFLKNDQDREIIAKRVADYSIKIDWVYQPLVHLQPIMMKLYNNEVGMLPFSEALAKTHICLPIHRGISNKDARFIANKLLECL